MGLGNFDIASFKPKRSETAASLLAFIPTKEQQKKEVTIQLRISDDKRQMFKEICSSCKVEMSDAIRAYIDSVIANGTL